MPKSDEDAAAEEAARRVRAGTDDIWIAVELLEEDIPPPQSPTASLPVQVGRMTVIERVKLAIRGGKEARMLLVLDSNKIVRRYVLANPRITEQEVAKIAQSRMTDEEQLRLISDKKEWVKSYQVRLALVKNPKTPLPTAIHLLGTIQQQDLTRMAKSRDLPDGVLQHARRIVVERNERRK